jgi:RHS repeat-associated protein
LTDDLGSVRLVGDVNGNYISRHDFLPFGEETSSSDPNRPVAAGFTLSDSATQRFTGKERDSESGLDYFGARYYGSALGRFSSPDPSALAFADPTNPQSFNLYSYGWNNPLVNTDPTGMSCLDTSNGKADDGDGQGCAAAGVSPSTQDQRDEGQDIQNPQHADVTGQNPSDLEYWTTISTHEIPSYDPNDLPLDDRARTIITLTSIRSSHDLACLGYGFAAGDAGGALFVSGQPNAGFRSPVSGKLVGGSKPFASGGASSGSSTLSGALRDALPQRLPGQVPTPVGGPGTGRALSMQGSNRLGVVLGRWAPFLGAALTAYELYKLNSCLSE